VQTGAMIDDPIGKPLQRLLDRVLGPGSQRVLALVEASQLHRPVMIGADEAVTAVRPFA